MIKWNKDSFISSSKHDCEPRISLIIIDLVTFTDSHADVINWGRG